MFPEWEVVFTNVAEYDGVACAIIFFHDVECQAFTTSLQFADSRRRINTRSVSANEHQESN